MRRGQENAGGRGREGGTQNGRGREGWGRRWDEENRPPVSQARLSDSSRRAFVRAIWGALPMALRAEHVGLDCILLFTPSSPCPQPPCRQGRSGGGQGGGGQGGGALPVAHAARWGQGAAAGGALLRPSIVLLILLILFCS